MKKFKKLSQKDVDKLDLHKKQNNIKSVNNFNEADSDELSNYFKQEAKKYLNPEDFIDTGTLTDKNKYFHELDLIDPILQALSEHGYMHPSPIQIKAIPIALERKDILATAQTGSGKTAAFSLPIIQLIIADKKKGKSFPRALIISPTRELTTQIGLSINKYTKFTRVRQVTVYGGVSKIPQIRQLERGKDIIVATPGRLLDLIDQGAIELNRIETLVLDEADRMLDMGFIDDILKVIEMIPQNSQIMLFSATMPEQIIDLAKQILYKPVRITVDTPTITLDTIDSSVFFVEQDNKFDLLMDILNNENIDKALVFMKTKHSADRIVKKLRKEKIRSDAIHGDKPQHLREKALKDFKHGNISILVATDVAARGIDVNNITHIINFDMSPEPEIYIHRIGRTARAGKTGIAYNFCNKKERRHLVRIEQLIQQHLKRAEDHQFMSHIPAPDKTDLHIKKSNIINQHKINSIAKKAKRKKKKMDKKKL